MIDWDSNLLDPIHEEFGEPANFRPKGGAPYDITGIFDRAHVRDIVTLEGDIAITDTKPVLGVRDVCFKSPPKQYDMVYIPRIKTLFVVMEVQPDSHGGTRLVLNEVKS